MQALLHIAAVTEIRIIDVNLDSELLRDFDRAVLRTVIAQDNKIRDVFWNVIHRLLQGFLSEITRHDDCDFFTLQHGGRHLAHLQPICKKTLFHDPIAVAS